MNKPSSHSVVIATHNATLSQANKNSLIEGGIVFVRVLQKTSAERGIVSFAGNRFEAVIPKNVAQGSSFSARLSFIDGKLVLTPQNAQNANNVQNANGYQLDAFSKLEQFKALNLVQNDLSFLLLQYIRAYNVTLCKTDIQTLYKKLELFLKKHPKTKMRHAVDASLYLAEKGIDFDDELVVKTIDLLDENVNMQILPCSKTLQKTNSFLDNFYKEPLFVLAKKTGLLTLFNHLSSTNLMQSGNWIILPFCTGTKKEDFAGTVRMRINCANASAEKIYISAKNGQKSLFFKIIPPKNLQCIVKISFAQVPEPSASEALHLTKMLQSLFAKDLRLEASYNQQIAHSLLSCEEEASGIDLVL